MSDIRDTGTIDWFLMRCPDKQDQRSSRSAPAASISSTSRLIRILDALVLVKRGRRRFRHADDRRISTRRRSAISARWPAHRRVAVRRGCGRGGGADADELPRDDASSTRTCGRFRSRSPPVRPAAASSPRPHPHPGPRGRTRLARVLNDRRNMPGLLRGVARTAVVAGTATAVSNRVSRRQANGWAQDDQSTYDTAAICGTADPAPAAIRAGARRDSLGNRRDVRASSQKLAQFHNQGILTEEEFAAQKAKILAG